jgi:hypothetical protein
MEREIEFNKVSIKTNIVQQHDNIVWTMKDNNKKREEKRR